MLPSFKAICEGTQHIEYLKQAVEPGCASLIAGVCNASERLQCMCNIGKKQQPLASVFQHLCLPSVSAQYTGAATAELRVAIQELKYQLVHTLSYLNHLPLWRSQGFCEGLEPGSQPPGIHSRAWSSVSSSLALSHSSFPSTLSSYRSPAHLTWLRKK